MISRLKNQRGQGMVEYLIVVALIAVGTMSIMRVLGQTTSVKFANITAVLQGSAHQTKIQSERLDTKHFKKRDMGDFFHGAKSNKRNSRR